MPPAPDTPIGGHVIGGTMADGPQPLGTILDTLDVNATVDPDDLVEAAVVILKVIEPDGDVRLTVGWTKGMSWIERRGMVEAARDCETATEFD